MRSWHTHAILGEVARFLRPRRLAIEAFERVEFPAMTRERYWQWMAVWKWIQTKNRTPELEILYTLLNEMWQQDRQSSTADELADYSSQKFDIESDPDFQEFMRDLNDLCR